MANRIAYKVIGEYNNGLLKEEGAYKARKIELVKQEFPFDKEAQAALYRSVQDAAKKISAGGLS